MSDDALPSKRVGGATSVPEIRRKLSAHENPFGVYTANEALRLLLASHDDLVAALRDAQATLIEAANILRPTLPSLADNIIGACVQRADAALAKAGGP